MSHLVCAGPERIVGAARGATVFLSEMRCDCCYTRGVCGGVVGGTGGWWQAGPWRKGVLPGGSLD